MFELTSGLLRRLKQMKGMKKNDMGVSPVIAVILMVAITVVLAGVLYLWVSSLADTDKDIEMIDVKSELIVDATGDDIVTIEVTSGTLVWADYYVKIDGGVDLGVPTTGGLDSKAGDVATWTIVGGGTLTAGDTFNLKIVNIENNAVVYDKDLICKAG